MRRDTRGTLPALALTALVLAGCGADTNPATELAVEERAIRAADQRMLAAAQANDPVGFAAGFTDDAVMLFPNLPAVEGRDFIEAKAAADFSTPGFTVSWSPTDLTIARAMDMAVSIGTYELSFTTPEGPVEDQGKYMTVWRKVNGEWRVAADMLNSSLPMGDG